MVSKVRVTLPVNPEPLSSDTPISASVQGLMTPVSGLVQVSTFLYGPISGGAASMISSAFLSAASNVLYAKGRARPCTLAPTPILSSEPDVATNKLATEANPALST